MDAVTTGRVLACLERNLGWHKRLSYDLKDRPHFYEHPPTKGVPLAGADRAVLIDILRTGTPEDIQELVRLVKA